MMLPVTPSTFETRVGKCSLRVRPLRQSHRAMRLAFPNPTGPVFKLTPELICQGKIESRESPRRRIILPIHREQEDLVQRMVNFLQPGTYIRAHQHPRVAASETIVVTSGVLGFVTFDSRGEILTADRLPTGGLVDIVAGVWHTVVALEEDTIIIEIKRGPYSEEDKVFAEWAPLEGSEGASAYLTSLMEQVFSAASPPQD